MNAPFFLAFEPGMDEHVQMIANGCLNEAKELTRLHAHPRSAEAARQELPTLIEARDELTRLIARIEAERTEKEQAA